MSEQKHLSHEEAMQVMAGIIKEVKFAMLTTITAEGHLHARPMTVQEKEYDGDLWFIGAKDSAAVLDIQQRNQVNVSFSSPAKGCYLSINGTAELVSDAAKLDELWSDTYNMYFEGGKQDPNVQLIKIHANGAEFWEGEGKVQTLVKMVKGMMGQEEAQPGRNETIEL